VGQRISECGNVFKYKRGRSCQPSPGGLLVRDVAVLVDLDRTRRKYEEFVHLRLWAGIAKATKSPIHGEIPQLIFHSLAIS
jgi:hypothetical protein